MTTTPEVGAQVRIRRFGIPCSTEGCEGRVEASAPMWLGLGEDGSWSLAGIGDEAAQIRCDDAGHENYTTVLGKSLSAFLEESFPGTTWDVA